MELKVNSQESIVSKNSSQKLEEFQEKERIKERRRLKFLHVNYITLLTPEATTTIVTTVFNVNR